ncbi:hypothetical protein DT075_06800 [Bacillus licheniformis]|nr:hypothetical protein DT075_06800 [Bacillus licheniformis]
MSGQMYKVEIVTRPTNFEKLKTELAKIGVTSAFGLHGLGGTWGGIATGLFATTSVNADGANGLFYGDISLLWKQLIAIAATYLFVAIVTYAIIKIVMAEWLINKKPTMLGAVSGAIAGLVAITPGAGFVTPFSSVWIGLIGGIVCFWGVFSLKKKFGYDDALEIVLGKRKNMSDTAPHNLLLTLLGATLIWFGWFGFNVGSALTIDEVAMTAFINTNTAAAAGLIGWIWIISGSFAERMRFPAFILFSVLWAVFVYSPVAHWVWGGGWLDELGAIDFAGGNVVHISSGVAGLVVGSIAIVSIIWILFGYSLAFAPGNPLIGGLDWIGLHGVGFEPNADYSETIPHTLYMMFQLTFAVLTTGCHYNERNRDLLSI